MTARKASIRVQVPAQLGRAQDRAEEKAPDPSPQAADAPQARETASAAPSDPGPPPRYPGPPQHGPHDVVLQLFEAGRRGIVREVPDVAGAREAVRAVSVLRAGPYAAQYQAEVLAWLDALEAYLKKN